MKNRTQLIGGKGMGLEALKKGGLNVPPFIILDITIFEEFTRDIEHQIKEIIQRRSLDHIKELEKSEQELKQLVLSTDFSSALKNKILNIIKAESSFNLDHSYFSVRSSAVDEDGSDFSFAGQMDSFLYVKGENNLFEKIKGCYASSFSARVLSYRHQNKLELLNIKMAVIVQKMIFGEVSGVLFTANPLTNNPDEMVVSATWGIGEGVVSGVLNCDNWVISNNATVNKEEIVKKEQMITFNEETKQSTITIDVPEEKSSVACLGDNQVTELYYLGKKIESEQGKIPQDIEWTYENESCYVLQTRPITTLKGINRNFEKTIWDNSNIVESYSGVTSPLTFSFASYAYDQVYRQFYNLMGTSMERINEMGSIFATMLGNIDGRIYYNLTNWYKTLKLLPGYNFNREFMESMMGVKDSGDVDKKEEKLSFYRRYLIELPTLLRGIFLIIKQFVVIDTSIKKFYQNYENTKNQATRIPFDNLSEVELVNIYRGLQRNLLGNWKTPIVNDFFTMIFYGVLKKLIISWKIDETGSIQNDLLCAQGDLESTKPTKDLIKMSNWISSHPTIKHYILENNEDDLTCQLINQAPEPQFLDLSRKLKEYIEAYGFRCVNELKLEVDSLKENPRFIFTMLKNYLVKGNIDLETLEKREKEKAYHAEKHCLKLIPKKKILFFFNRKNLFFWVVKQTKKAVKNREELRFTRTKVFGLSRQIFNAISRKFCEAGIIYNPKDIYLLSVDEIIAPIEGRSITSDYKKLIEQRKLEYDNYQNGSEPPERFFTYGPYYRAHKITPTLPDPLAGLNLGPDVLKGTPCCPGTISKECRVVLSPQDDCQMNGEILVTKRTDPGWVPIFPSISGLLIEKGSILSHSAVVAREMGIPTIVGLTDVTEKIKNGQKVALDGSKGLVHLGANQEELDNINLG